MSGFDLFAFYRMTLFVFLGTYTVLLTVTSIRRLLAALAGDLEHKQFMRTYLAYLLLTARLEPLRGELAQIAFWLTLLLILWRLHPLV